MSTPLINCEHCGERVYLHQLDCPSRRIEPTYQIPTVDVKIISRWRRPTPGKHVGDIGMDIAADLDSSITLYPGRGAFVPCGFEMQLLPGWAALVLPRSSSNRAGLHICTGVIDNGYAGPIGAEVRNLSSGRIIIDPGDRIAQVVLIPAYRPNPVVVEQFTPTDRGSNGWGSSG